METPPVEEELRISAEFGEDILTSPKLPDYANRIRNKLLANLYSEQGTSTREWQDIISLAASQFIDDLEAVDIKALYEGNNKYQHLADTLFMASSSIAEQ